MRYYNQQIFTNDHKAYKNLLKNRGLKFVNQYETPKFEHPQLADYSNFNIVDHVWGLGDRYYKLADQFYDDPTKWWVIALFNQKPTDFHIDLGEVVYVPTPLNYVLYYLGY